MSNNPLVAEPDGISFYSIRTGETHFGKLEPTIAAYINSSDMGINASRGQDMGWRLHPDWVKKVRDFRRDATKMSILTSKNGGQKPTLTQILYYMYGEQLQAWLESQEENENPYEEAYAQAIAQGGFKDAPEKPELPAALKDFVDLQDDEEEDIADVIDDVMTEDETKATQTETPKLTEEEQKAADELAKMDAEKAAKKAKK